MTAPVVRVEAGDMLDVLPRLAAEGVRVSAIITDPPYHLTTSKLAGFMGKTWDGGDIAFRPETWRLCHELLPPGGHLLAFGGTRTYHRIACAIEDAGFEIRDMLAWLYGMGFPKSRGHLKPALEPLCIARKPLDGSVAANVAAHGTGAFNIDACRIHAEQRTMPSSGQYTGLGGTRGFAIGARPARATELGRWPANVAHDGSEEVLAAFPDAGGGFGKQHARHDGAQWEQGSGFKNDGRTFGFGDSGSAARFFYSAKADAADRLGSKHATVKPVELVRWLVRLVTPPGGIVLDPFAGSGTTAMACMAEGFDCVAVEREPEYVADIRRRVAHVHGNDTPLFGGDT